MNRIIRRFRRGTSRERGTNRVRSREHQTANRLVAEQLENRLLLTTLTLLEGSTAGETIFRYADPEDNDPGSDVSVYNEIHIGTLSGLPPEKDVEVEILDYNGQDIAGTLFYEGQVIDINGGPGGVDILDEVPSDVLGGLGFAIDCLATNPVGNTFGITTGGFLVVIDTVTGQIDEILGEVIDTNNIPSHSGEIRFTDFDAADFDPITQVLYAVVSGPTGFDVLGNVTSTGETLITINVDPNAGVLGEAEAVGRNPLAQADYRFSEVIANDITTIVYNGRGDDGISEPIFLAFDAGVPDNETIPSQFVNISVVDIENSNAFVVNTLTVASAEEDDVVEGMMFDNLGRLFGLHHTAGNLDDGMLVLINLAAPLAGRYTDIVEFGDQPTGGEEPPPIFLTGMSYDAANDIGYATDPTSGTLYEINTALLQQVDDDFVIVGGLADVFMVYIASSTPDTYITFTTYVPSDTPPVYFPTSGTPAYLFTDEDDSSISTPGDAGGVMIGTGPVVVDDNIIWSPMITTFFNSSGLAPYTPAKGVWPGGEYRPGIVLAETGFDDPEGFGKSQEIGLIQVGGGVFGDVIINGSIDTFYAGYLATNRFQVEGDLNTLVVNTQAGGIVESDDSWTSVGSAKYGGDGVAPSVVVEGKLGSFYGHADWGLPIEVLGSNDVSAFSGARDVNSGQYVPVHREIERKNTPDPLGFTFLQGGMESSDGYIVTNDDPATAQFLGTVEEGVINVVGETEAITFDPNDFYSFGVLAGQTVEIEMFFTFGTIGSSGHPLLPDSHTSTGGGLGLFDPDLNLVAVYGEADIATGAPMVLEYTADEAGIYTVQIGAVLAYRLQIEGVSTTTLGGGNVLANTRNGGDFVDEKSLIEVTSGNLGAVNIGALNRSSRIQVNQGSLSGLRAGGYTQEISDSGSAILDTPSVETDDNIGMVQGLGGGAVDIQTARNLQSLEMTGVYSGMAVAGQNIGEITINGDMMGPGFFANSDGQGDPGIIDRLYVSGNWGMTIIDDVTIYTQVALSVGARGGNVRFVNIGGEVVHTSTTGIGVWGPFDFDPGQSVMITDDSGALVRVAPGFVAEEVEDFLFGAQLTEPDPDATVSDGGVLTVKMLPVWDITWEDFLATGGGAFDRTILGYAIAGIDSTDGLKVTTNGGSVELGQVTVVGDQDNQVFFNGRNEISALQVSVSGTIEQIVNNTGGDLVSVVIAEGTGTVVDEGDGQQQDDEQVVVAVFPLADQPFALIKINGNLGWTESSTGQRVQSAEIVAADEALINPIGSQTTGLVSAAGIDRITIAGSMGDTNITGDVNQIVLNSDNSREVDQFDGIAGAILIGGNLDRISLGDGIHHPGTGIYANSGLFVTGELNRAEISGPGHDINGPLYATGEIHRIRVNNGARIVGFNGRGGQGERVRGAFFIADTIAVTSTFDDYQLFDSTTGTIGDIGVIEVRGRGSEIRGAWINCSSIDVLRIVSGAEGIFDSRIRAAVAGPIGTDNGVIGQITVGGAGIHNTLIEATQNIGRLTVSRGGTIEDSEIRSAINVGTITVDEINRTDIDAPNKLDRVTVREGIFDLVIEAGELGKLTVKEDILGSGIIVGGSVGTIQAKGDIISTIEVTGPFGNLKKLKAGGDIGTPSGGEIIVDGKVGSIQAGGDFLADLVLNWDTATNSARYNRDGYELNSLKVGGKIVGLADIGGDVNRIQGGDEFGVFGSQFTVHGDLKNFKVGSGKNSADLESSLTVNEDLGVVAIYGNLKGDINVVEDFNKLIINGGDQNGDITVGGDFNKMIIIGGDSNGGIDVAGEFSDPIIRGSDIVGKWVIGGGDNLKIDGSITSTGRYISTDDVGTLWIKGSIEAGGVLDITGDLDKLIVEGDIYGVVHVTGSIGEIQAGNIDGLEAIVTAGADIGQVSVSGTIANSYVLAGFDAGVILDNDGTVLLTRNEQVLNGEALTGSIDKIDVGVLNNAVIAAGVSPGGNVIFGDLDDSDIPGIGLSSIGKVKIGLTVGTGSPFGVFADTQIGNMRINGRKLQAPVFQGDGFRAWTVDEPVTGSIGGIPFEQGMQLKDIIIGGKSVTVVMTGPGRGQLLPGTSQIDTIQLRDTTSKTKIKITAKGADTIDVGELFNGDDENLGLLLIDGMIANSTYDASMELGGAVTKLKLGGVGDGVEVTISGDVVKAELGQLGGTSSETSIINILGDVKQLRTSDISDTITINVEDVNQVLVKGDMDGTLSSQNSNIGTIKIIGDMAGVISAEGDIDKVQIKGMLGDTEPRTIQGVRAGGNIGTFSAESMSRSVVAAGANLDEVKITQDVSFSTIAGGLNIGPAGILFDGDEVAGQGDLEKVQIGGDFVQSNIIAGLTPGDDGIFATGDDEILLKAIEEKDAPRIAKVFFEGKDLTTINIQFQQKVLDATGNIGKITIKGDAVGSGFDLEQFAIAAAGKVDSVFVDRQAFGGVDNVKRIEIGSKDILGSTLEMTNVTSANANTIAFQVRGDGYDHTFGTADDIIISSDADPNTQPTVFVTFDPETNIASFHNSEGFKTNRLGTNYYEIRLDAGQITNRLGIPLDGEYSGEQLSGDGVPGGDFVFYFAVEDLGDTLLTAFSPFGQFPENLTWSMTGQAGNNNEYSNDLALNDQDFIRLNGLEQGQMLNVTITDSNESASGTFMVQLWRIVDDDLQSGTVIVRDFRGRENIAVGAQTDVPADVVVPGLDELAYAEGVFYGYENLGGTFYTLDRDNFAVTLLDNTLEKLNNLVLSEGTIVGLWGLAGAGHDSVWAIADFRPNTGPNAGEETHNLVLINKLSQDVNNVNLYNRAEVVISDVDISSTYSSIVGLELIDGVLYGVDTATNSLITFDSNVTSGTFGLATLEAELTGEDNLVIDDLVITGLASNLEGNNLIILHDQPVGVTDNFLVDALYQMDIASGQVSEDPLHEFAEDAERHGLATEPGGSIIAGLPLRGSPVGDTMEVTFGNLGTQDHEFGSDSVTDFFGGHAVISNPSQLPMNSGLQEFVEAGFYYAFDITYGHGPKYQDITVTITDIDWINDTDNGILISAVTDDPANVIATIQPQFLPTGEIEYNLVVEIEADSIKADGDVRVYFAGTSEIEILQSQELVLAGEVIGRETRDDLTPGRDMLLPDMDELSISQQILLSETTVVLTNELKQVLSADLQEQLAEGVTFTLMNEVEQELITAGRIDLFNNFLNNIINANYDAVGYDSQQEIFALVSTETFMARPVLVNNPENLDDDPTNDVVLTREVLGDILALQPEHSDKIINNIRALDFGAFDEGDERDPGDDMEPLYAIVTVTTTGTSQTHDYLLQIEDILDPYAGLNLSVNPLQVEVDNVFYELNITSLAYGNVPGNHEINGRLYGIHSPQEGSPDSPPTTLITIDPRTHTSTAMGIQVPNINYGMAEAVGGTLSNLGEGAFDIIGIDFDSEARLLGIEANSNTLMRIFTNTVVGPNKDYVLPVLELPPGDYRDLTFDVDPGAGFFAPSGPVLEAGFLVNAVTGTPWEDPDPVQIRVNGGDWFNHTYGGASTPINNVTITSPTEPATETALREFKTEEGGYYRFDVTYTTGHGNIQLELTDIEWPVGSIGEVDSIFLSDPIFALVNAFDDDSIIVDINSNGGAGTLTIYFGAAGNLHHPSTGDQTTELVEFAADAGEVRFPVQIPQDGDYILNIEGLTEPADYVLDVQLFNDGDSDFGLSVTPSDILYEQLFPNNRPVNLEPLESGNTDLVRDEDDPNLYTYNPASDDDPRLDWPIAVEGTLLEPGETGSVMISAELGCEMDVDVFSFRLEEGQQITVDIEAETLFGRDALELWVGIYNGDFEVLATIMDEADDVLAPTAAQQAETLYKAQAIFTMPNHEEVVIDPDENGLGTYYVVVSTRKNDALDKPMQYQLTVQTAEPEPTIETPPSQLVWLAFDGARADYLLTDNGGLGGSPDVVNRPAFDESVFNLSDRTALIEAIAEKIEGYYRDAGLSEDEIEFTTVKPGSADSIYPAGSVYSTVIFGGKSPMVGLLGIAEKLDRHNEDRSDTATVYTDELAWAFLSIMDEDPNVRFEQAANAVANTGAHELAHNLGLEHATEINVPADEANNMMGYSSAEVRIGIKEFAERNSYRLHSGANPEQIGFANEVDMLLRYIGSGTVMGA